MTSDANIIIGIQGDPSGGKTIQRTLDDIDRSSSNAKRGVAELTKQVLSLAAAYFSVRTVVNQVNAAIGAGQQLQALRNQMNAATKDAHIAAESFDFLRSLTERLGLEFTTTAHGFASFSAAGLRAGLTFGDVKSIFEDVATAATSMQLPAEKVEGIFTALEQMASKGSVQMQELKLQLGNNLPGAFEIFAKSMGVTTTKFNEMISNGEVGIDKLRGFAAELKNELGGSAVEASKQLTAEQNRLKTATFDLRTEFANSGALKGYTDLTRELATLYKDKDFIEGVKNLGAFTGIIFEVIRIGLKDFREFIKLMNEWKTTNQGFSKSLDDSFFGALDNIDRKLGRGALVDAANKKAAQDALTQGQSGIPASLLYPKSAPIVVPGGGKSSNDYTLGAGNMGGLTKAQEDAQKKIEKVTESLKFQLDQLKRNDVEQDVYNNLKAAGVSIDSVAGQNIANLTRELDANTKTLEKQKEVYDKLGEASSNFLKDTIKGVGSLSDRLRGLAADLIDIAYQMAVIEPIKQNLFGGGGGGLFSFFGSLFSGGGSSYNPAVSPPPVKPPVPPGFAGGGSMTLGGRPGIDQNMLSLNGVPIARTGRGEVLSVSPTGKSGTGDIIIHQQINLSLGVQEAVAQQVSAILPQLEKSTHAAIQEAQLRGIKA